VATLSMSVLAIGVALPVGVQEGKAAAASPTIKVGMILALSGPESAGQSQAVQAASARVAAANAAGGIKGQKIQIIAADSQGTTQGSLTAAQTLVSKGVVAVIGTEPPFEGPAQQYLSQQGIPMTEAANDAALINDPNVFSVVGWSGAGLPISTSVGVYLKKLGAKTVAGSAYGSVAPAVSILNADLAASTHVGIKTVLKDLSPAPTTVDFTSDALQVKQSGADYVIPEFASEQEFAFAQALQQQGAKTIPLFGPAFLEKSILSSPGASSLEGPVESWFAPVALNATATKTFAQTLKKYAPGVYGGFLEEWAYVSADLFIKGLQGIKGAVTPASLKAAIKKIKNYNGAGLVPASLNFSAPKSATQNLQRCYYYATLKNGEFSIAAGATPVCGSLIPAGS
jgi:branched-chain amino acid transport system substrate-binding protein